MFVIFILFLKDTPHLPPWYKLQCSEKTMVWIAFLLGAERRGRRGQRGEEGKEKETPWDLNLNEIETSGET